MEARFGNMSAAEFELYTNVVFEQGDADWIDSHRVNKANFRNDDGIHIFKYPLGIVAGSNVGEELVTRLRKYSGYERHFYVETKETGF